MLLASPFRDRAGRAVAEHRALELRRRRRWAAAVGGAAGASAGASAWPLAKLLGWQRLAALVRLLRGLVGSLGGGWHTLYAVIGDELQEGESRAPEGLCRALTGPRCRDSV